MTSRASWPTDPNSTSPTSPLTPAAGSFDSGVRNIFVEYVSGYSLSMMAPTAPADSSASSILLRSMTSVVSVSFRSAIFPFTSPRNPPSPSGLTAASGAVTSQPTL